MSTPTLSVILPAYNAAQYIDEAITSILKQDYSDFELIIADDGSTDLTLQHIQAFNDSRIRLIKNETNIGLIDTLNSCIANSRGEFIARMDADDISLPNRFTQQINYLQAHPNIGIVSSFMSVVGEDSRVYSHRFTESEYVKAALAFTNPIVHPSVVFRKSAIKGQGLYSKNFLHAEDYGLWITLLKDVSFHVLENNLLSHRSHSNQISVQHYVQQKQSVGRAHEQLFRYLGFEATEEEKETHFALFLEKYPSDPNFVERTEAWLMKLVRMNRETKLIQPEIFENVAGEWWFRVNQELSLTGLSNFKRYNHCALSSVYEASAAAKAKMVARSFGIGRKSS